MPPPSYSSFSCIAPRTKSSKGPHSTVSSCGVGGRPKWWKRYPPPTKLELLFELLYFEFSVHILLSVELQSYREKHQTIAAVRHSTNPCLGSPPCQSDNPPDSPRSSCVHIFCLFAAAATLHLLSNPSLCIESTVYIHTLLLPSTYPHSVPTFSLLIYKHQKSISE